jgi:hypothetical protein
LFNRTAEIERWQQTTEMQEIAFFSFEHVANLYGLYQYAFSAKGVFREE